MLEDLRVASWLALSLIHIIIMGPSCGNRLLAIFDNRGFSLPGYTPHNAFIQTANAVKLCF